MNAKPTPTVADLLRELCAAVQHDPSAGLARLDLADIRNCLVSSFQVGLLAQAGVAAAALAANEVYARRTGRYQDVSVSRLAAERECTGLFQLNGVTPDAWDAFSGLYATRDGHVRVHANFPHHRDGALALLGLNAGSATKADMAAALLEQSAEDYERAAADAGLVVAKVRSFAEWDAHPQGIASAAEPILRIERTGDAPPKPLPELKPGQRPLTGLKFLEFTRILAGPVCGRTLAAYGGEVLLVNRRDLPNIPHIVDTSRGKRSAFLDLRTDQGRSQLDGLLKSADAFVQGYRPEGLSELGFGPREIARRHPGVVYTTLSAYGFAGPWANRRGFDSLVQTATGFNHAEQDAFGAELPKPLPVQILDFASGFLMAFGTQLALARRAEQGGSWHVQVSLLQTANWLRRMGRSDQSVTDRAQLQAHLQSWACTEGQLRAMPHAAQFSDSPANWRQPSVAPGKHDPVWSQEPA